MLIVLAELNREEQIYQIEEAVRRALSEGGR